MTIGIQKIAAVFYHEVLREAWKDLLPPRLNLDEVFESIALSPDVLNKVFELRNEILKQSGKETVMIEVLESKRGGVVGASGYRDGSHINAQSSPRRYKIVDDHGDISKWWKVCCFSLCDVELFNSDRLVQSQETATQETATQEDEEVEEDESEEYKEDDESTSSESSRWSEEESEVSNKKRSKRNQENSADFN